jgi:hypothetical protein
VPNANDVFGQMATQHEARTFQIISAKVQFSGRVACSRSRSTGLCRPVTSFESLHNHAIGIFNGRFSIFLYFYFFHSLNLRQLSRSIRAIPNKQMSTPISREERLQMWRMQKEKVCGKASCTDPPKKTYPSLQSKSDVTPRKPLGATNVNIPKSTPSKETKGKLFDKENVAPQHTPVHNQVQTPPQNLQNPNVQTPQIKSVKQTPVKTTPESFATKVSKKHSPPPAQLTALDNIFSPGSNAHAVQDVIETYESGGWTPQVKKEPRLDKHDRSLTTEKLQSQLSQVQQELRDAYECIELLEKREDWMPREKLLHEVDQIRQALEQEWQERFSQVELTLSVAEEERDAAVKKRAQLEHALAECIEENEQVGKSTNSKD